MFWQLQYYPHHSGNGFVASVIHDSKKLEFGQLADGFGKLCQRLVASSTVPSAQKRCRTVLPVDHPETTKSASQVVRTRYLAALQCLERLWILKREAADRHEHTLCFLESRELAMPDNAV